MKKVIFATLSAMFVASLSFPAFALTIPTISIGVQDGSGSIDTIANGIGGAGGSYFIGGSQGWYDGTVSATGTPPLTEGSLASDTLSTDITGAGTLKIFVTERGLTQPVGQTNFLSGFTLNFLFGDVTSVTESTLISTSNALYTGSLLSSDKLTAIGSDEETASAGLNGTYSLTLEYAFTATGPGTINASINVTDPTAVSSVPEPGTVALMGIGLVALGLLMAGSRKNTARIAV